jgi:hypothetical protein
MANHNDGSDPVREALWLLRQTLETETRHIKEALKERGRKTDAPAARAVGIGWLAGSIRGLTDKANLMVVADLAEAVLDDGDVTEEMVRKALTPQKRLDRGRELRRRVQYDFLGPNAPED